MAEKLLFVHLSDIHFNGKSETTRGLNRAIRNILLEDLRDGKDHLGSPAAVLVTGDIAFSGKPEEFKQAREFLGEVTDTLGIGPELVQTVPGNHDVDRNKISTSIDMVHTALRGADATASDLELNKLLAEPGDLLFAALDEYNRFAAAYECQVSNSAPFWEVTWQISDSLRLRMRGLTTVLVSDSKDEKANLILGTLQTALAADYNETDIGVVLGHHPPDWWHDRIAASGGLQRFANLHLYGHEHVHKLSIDDESVRLVAGAVHPDRNDTWLPRYNWVAVSVEEPGVDGAAELIVEVWPRAFIQEHNQFESDSKQGEWLADREVVNLSRYNHSRSRAADVAESPNDMPVRPTGQDIEPSRRLAPVVDFSSLEHELIRRTPVVDEDGVSTEFRRTIFQFAVLKYGTQLKILTELGLIEQGDRVLGPDELSQRAFARARQKNLLDELTSKVSDAAVSGS